MFESIIRDADVLELDTDFFTTYKFEPMTIIDDGMCGEIVLAKSLEETKRKCIVKKFNLLNKERLERSQRIFNTEVKFMQSLNHPYLTKCLLAAKCPEYLAISMCYYERKTLDHFVGNVSIEISELCVIQVACALRYMHRNNLAHLDVKLDNIFLDDEFNAILGDFGLAVELSPQQLTAPRRRCGGTPSYFAPEYRAAKLDEELDPYKLDSYCLGVVLWCLVLGQEPDTNINYYLEARRKRDIQPNIRDMLLRLLQRNPTRRVTVADFLDRVRRDSIHRHVIVEN